MTDPLIKELFGDPNNVMLTRKEYRYMQVIEEARVVTCAEFGEFMCITSAFANKILNHLHDKGLVAKRDCALPNKPHQYLLTIEGKTLVNILKKLKRVEV